MLLTAFRYVAQESSSAITPPPRSGLVAPEHRPGAGYWPDLTCIRAFQKKCYIDKFEDIEGLAAIRRFLCDDFRKTEGLYTTSHATRSKMRQY